MEIKTQDIEISRLQPNSNQIEGLPRNPRKISKKKLEQLKKSVQDAPEMLRLRELIAVEHDGAYVVICGNQRLEAAKALKMETLPVKVLPADTPVEKLREYAIKDNLPFGEDDWEILTTDWDVTELEEWGMDVPDVWKDTTEAVEDEFNAEEVVEVVCQKYDVWQLGRHRLMCGDSTDQNDVAVLMDGNKADIAFTSPPYNMKADEFKPQKKGIVIAMRPNGDKTYSEYNDNVTDDEYTGLLCSSLDNGLQFSTTAMWNIGILAGSKIGIINMLHKFQDKFCDIIVWKKKIGMPCAFPSQRHLLKHNCELIFCFNQEGNRAFPNSQWEPGDMGNCIETENASGTNEYAKEHAATFPVALPSEIIKNFTDTSVLDLFGGTGTTLIAAEQLNRTCYMMELDPHYCDIIIARWEKLTGQKAVKLN